MNNHVTSSCMVFWELKNIFKNDTEGKRFNGLLFDFGIYI